MGAVTWTAYGTADDVGGTAFNSLADGSGAISSEIDNSSNLKRWGDLEVTQGSSVTSSGTDARIDVYLIPVYDGTNYPVPGSAGTTFTATYFVGSISSVDTVGTIAVTSFTNGVLRSILLPPTKFKIGLVNELGASFNSSVTVKLRRYSETVA